MNNINVRVVGTANVTQMSGAFGKLEAQVTALNSQLARMVALQNGVDASGYDRMARAAATNDRVWRSAVASTGMFEQQQLRVNKATDTYIDQLNRQKLSFRELAKQRKIASAAYKEQLAMEQMVVRKSAQTNARGKQMFDVTYPKEISADLNTASNRLAFFNEQLKSGATQMVNWGKNTQWAGRQLMVGFTVPFAAAGAAAGVMAYQVDKELTRVAKVYDTTADANAKSLSGQMKYEKELSNLRQAGVQTAITAAREYGVAATDTLNVQAELAATGLAGKDLQKNTEQIMRIARLGELEYQDAVQASISLQTVFKMSTEELGESFNYMNSVENATSLSTADFAAAIPIAAAPVKAFGGDIKELGILLTAMKEQGVGASEGANAIKATMQRLARPSKQIREEFEALTGQNITEIVEGSGSLTEIFTKLNEITSDMPLEKQRKVFAGLFGSYQVSRMMAMTKGMGDLQAGVGQVSAAYEISNKSAEEWADTADREIERYQKSISGRFDTALQEVKIQMATLGEPFVQVATFVLKGVSQIIEGFNGLPGPIKVVAAGLIGLAAVAGPLVMMTGLFANLLGNGIKIIAGFIGAVTKMNGGMAFATTQQRAAAMAAKLNSTEMTKEMTSAEMLRLELNKLALAQQAANRASREQRVNQMVGAGTPRSAAYAQLAAERRADLKNRGLMNSSGESTNAVQMAAITRQNESSSANVAKNWKNVAVGAGTAAAAGSIFLMHSDGIVGKAAKIVFYASLLGPILTPLGPILVRGFQAATVQATRLGGVMKANLATATATAAASSVGGKGAAGKAGGALAGTAAVTNSSKVMNALKTGGKFLLTGTKAISKAMGPAGWAITGALTVGTIWAGVHKRQEEMRKRQEETLKEQRNTANLMVSSAKDYADVTGTTLENLKGISRASVMPGGNAKQNELLALYNSEEMKPQMDMFKNATTSLGSVDMFSSEQYAVASQKFWELQVRNGQSAKEAAANIRAMYIAAGRPMYEADKAGKNLLETIGDISKASNDVQVNSLRNLSRLVTQPNDTQALATGAEQLWDQFAYAFENAAMGADSSSLMGPLMDSVNTEWDESFVNLEGKYREALKSIGVTTGDDFRKFMEQYTAGTDTGLAMYESLINNNRDLRDDLTESGSSFGEVFNNATAGASAFEKSLIQAAQKATGVEGDFKNIRDLFADPFFTAKTENLTMDKAKKFTEGVINTINQRGMIDPGQYEKVSSEITYSMAQIAHAAGLSTEKVDSMGDALTLVNSILPKNNNLFTEYSKRVESVTSRMDFLKKLVASGDLSRNSPEWMGATEDSKQLMDEMVDILNSAGIKTDKIKTLEQARVALQKMFNRDLGAVPKELDTAADAAKNLETSLKNAFSGITKADAIGVIKNSMADIQQDIAEDMRNTFDEQMNSALDSRQAMWDKRSESLQNSFDRQSRQLDRKWERKNDAATEYWDNRAKKVDKVIERETKAEEKRQKMFDNEMSRIDRLNETMNRNVDFNMALNTGNLDEAAKIRNDAAASTANTLLERAAAQTAARSDKRISGLEGRKEVLDAARDKYMERLKNQEDAERRSVERTQRVREKALRRETEADMKTQRKIWESRKKNLEKQLDLFLAFTAANEKQLKKHMANVGISYKNFERDTIRPTGKRWGDYFGEKMREGIKKHGLALAGDRMWEKMGKESALRMVKGIGFKGMGEFRNFIRTGELGEGVGKKRPKNTGMGPETRHEGGFVGSGAGSRKGVARTTRGLHASETMVRAQKGEYVVNRDAAQKHADVLESINSGAKPDMSRGNKGRGVGGGTPSVAGLLMGAINRGVSEGLGKKIETEYAKKSMQAMMSGMFGAGAAGMYGDRAFNQSQLKNAATIASVGSSMGMSARDIMIGIMTAITESGLVNVNFGDRDSLGLFQQRPSQGWGTPEQVTNPDYASRKFFEGLKGIGNRGGMAPWLAAQAVQRSAFSDGSNYRIYWDEAQAIFQNGLSRSKGGGFVAGGAMNYAQGKGGLHRATVPGKGWTNSHDYGNGLKSPLYAIDDGTIIESKALPPSSGSGQHPNAYPRGYGSYGVTVVLRTKGGDNIRYAHMWPGTNIATGPVKGGTMVGLSASTGNSSGPHTHFDINGSYAAREWFASHGIPLKKGGTIERDGTPAVLHKNERVLTAPLTKKLDTGIETLLRLTQSAKKKKEQAKKKPKKKPMRFPTVLTGQADSPRTWMETETISDAEFSNTLGLTGGARPSRNVANGPVAGGPRGGKGTVRTGTYNVFRKTSNAQSRADLKRLFGQADVLSLTEMIGGKRGLVPWLQEQGWSYYGPAVNGNDTGVAWNSRKYSATDKGYQMLNPKTGTKGAFRNRPATYVKLTDKDTGQSFYQVSAHTAGHAQRGNPNWRGVMNEQYASLNKLVERLSKGGMPVFLAGDLNTNAAKTKTKVGFKGLKDGSAVRGLDRVFGPDEAKLVRNNIIRGLSSDHNALLSSFSIPGLRDGGSIKWDNTIANLHKNERVLTAPLTRKFEQGVDRFADGGATVYNINMVANEVTDGKKLFKEFKDEIRREEARKPRSRRQ